MNADYSELGNFFIDNTYPYVDLNNHHNSDFENTNGNLINDISKKSKDVLHKNIATSEALNIPVKTEIKVLSHAGDRAFSVYDGYLVYQQTGSMLDVLIHFYEEAISDIIFSFGLKGTSGNIFLNELLVAAPRQITKKTIIVSGLFLVCDYALNPYISKSFSDFIKRYNIPILSIPYLLNTHSKMEQQRKQSIEEMNRLLDYYGLSSINNAISMEDIFFNLGVR